MNLTKFSMCYFIMVVFSGCMTIPDNKALVEKYIGVKLQENEVTAYVAKIDNEFETPGFKGLHLGMSHTQVNDLVKNTYWAYKDRYGKKEDEPDYGTTVTIGRKQYLSPVDWDSIGCYGRQGEEYCHWTEGIYLKYYNDKVIYIGIDGMRLSADEIEGRVKNWGKFALDVLTNKYGPPSKTNKSLDKIGILDFKSGYKVTICYWNLGENKIRLTIDEEGSRFGCSLVFENVEGAKKVREEESKVTSSF